jgi:hypothetical protein
MWRYYRGLIGDAYITLWSQPQVEIQRRALYASDTLDHVASGQFKERGIDTGDRVYVLATQQGRLLLLGRLTVERVVDQLEAERHVGHAVYPAPDHLIGNGTPLNLDRVVPERIARAIQRESGKRIKIASDAYVVDANSLRATGRITEDSAAMLDTVLGEGSVIVEDEHGELEGRRRETRHEVIERSSRLRSRALAYHGPDCRVCGFSFAGTYGPLGDGFAEVHHLAPLATSTGAVLVDPVTDVVVLCANCHRMVHRKDPPLTPDDLRSAIAEHR